MEEQNELSVLRLNENKFYIDYTRDIIRILNGRKKTSWTERYQPIEIIETLPVHTENDIDNYVRLYMKHYGTNSTRGGIYKNIKISRNERNDIQNRLMNSSDNIYEIGNLFQSRDEIITLRTDRFMYFKDKNKYKTQKSVFDQLDI